MRRVIYLAAFALIALLILQCEVDDPIGSFQGTVTDSVTGEPLPNVLVVLKSGGTEVATASTDSNGTYSIKPVRVLAYDFEVTKGGYDKYSKEAVTPVGLDYKKDIQLVPLGSLTGFVTDVDNKAISGVQLRLNRNNGSHFTELSDQDGAFSFSRLESDIYSLVITKDGFLQQESAIDIAIGEQTLINVILKKRASIYGLVTDETGTGIQNAQIILSTSGSQLKSALTNNEGSYAFRTIDAGIYNVTASKVGYITSRKNDLEITRDEQRPLDFNLTSPPQISGIVTDQVLQSLEGVKITLTGNSVTNSVVFTDSQGEYTFSGLGFHQYQLLFEKNGYNQSNRTVSITQGVSHNPVNHILESQASIFGTVIDKETAQPIPQAQVTLSLAGEETESIQSNDLGAFSFKDLKPGDYTITAFSTGYEHNPKKISLDRGKNAQTVLLLQPLSSSFSLSLSNLNFSSNNSTQTFDIVNDGQGIITWNVQSDVDGLKFEPRAGTTSPNKKSSITARLDRNDIPVGNYSQQITVSTQRTGSANIGMSYEVKGKLCAHPNEITFDSESDATIELTNCGEGLMGFEAKATKTWIKVLPSVGTLSANKTEVSVRIDRNLAPGNYEGSIEFTSDGGTESVKIRMSIEEPEAPQLTISKSELDFGDELETLSLLISNTGGSDLTWSSERQPWIKLSKSSGTLRPEEGETIVVSVKRDEVAANAITNGRINFFSTNSNGDIDVDVIVSTLSRPKMNTSKKSLDFGAFGERLSFEITNSGTQQLKWEIDQPSAEWFTATPTQGIDNQRVEVTVNRSMLINDGTYTGHLTIRSEDGQDELVEVRLNQRSILPELSATISGIETEFGENQLSADATANLFIKISNKNEPEIDEAPGVHITIGTQSALVSILSDTIVQYGDLRPGESEIRQFKIRISPEAPIDEIIPFEIIAWDQEGYSVATQVTTTIAPLLSNQLTSYFDFDSEIARDLIKRFTAGDNNVGISIDTPSGFGKSASFNAAQQSYISMGTNLTEDYNGDASFNLWMKSEQRDQSAVLFHASVNRNDRVVLSINEENQIYASGINFKKDLSNSLLNGSWHMLTVVLSTTGNLLYVDGKQITTEPDTHHLMDFSGLPEGWVIGKRGIDNLNFYDGLLDNIRLYKRALTVEEIELLYGRRQ